MTTNDYYFCEEAAAVLGISRGLVSRLIKHGKLPCVRRGKKPLLPRRAVDRIAAARLRLSLADKDVAAAKKVLAEAVKRRGELARQVYSRA